MTCENGLLVMAKRPFPGQTKTRLSPPLSPKAAAHLYERFLHDVVSKVAALPNVSPYIAYAPRDAEAYFETLAPRFGRIAQRGTTLGERLDHVLAACRARGHRCVVAMNSDSPNLPKPYLVEAFETLRDAAVDVVLGPCDDGGYYLIGWKRPYPPLVRNVQMSTTTVLHDTLAIAERLDLNVVLLPAWYDVDSAAELTRLRDDLRRDPASAIQAAAFLSTLRF